MSPIDRWMLRIVNVVQALTQRGYPAWVEATLHLSIHDDLLSENTGHFILRVSQGRGAVEAGGEGHLKLSVQALTPLYSGFCSPMELHQMGRLESTEEALAIATQLFVGSIPWMPDFF
jgi:predicted acetyltransferase